MWTFLPPPVNPVDFISPKKFCKGGWSFDCPNNFSTLWSRWRNSFPLPSKMSCAEQIKGLVLWHLLLLGYRHFKIVIPESGYCVPSWFFDFISQLSVFSKISQILSPNLKIFTQGSYKPSFRSFGWLIHKCTH